MRLTSLPAAMVSTARPGQQVRLNEAMAIVETMTYDHTGELVTVKELIGTHRAMVVGRGDDERVVNLAGSLIGRDGPTIRTGDSVLVDLKAGYALEKIDKSKWKNSSLKKSHVWPTKISEVFPGKSTRLKTPLNFLPPPRPLP